MSGHQPFKNLTKDFTPRQRARVESKKQALRDAMPQLELRQARAMTQKALGKTLNVEQHADLYVSSLRAYIESMGGRLRIVAEFPQGQVTITKFSEAGDAPQAT